MYSCVVTLLPLAHEPCEYASAWADYARQRRRWLYHLQVWSMPRAAAHGHGRGRGDVSARARDQPTAPALRGRRLADVNVVGWRLQVLRTCDQCCRGQLGC